MKMTFRWYGEGRDNITLKQIRQIPGMTGLMGLLDEKAAGEIWTEEEIRAYMEHVHAAGLECEVIESVNVTRISRWGSRPEINTLKITASPSAIWQNTA